MTRIDENDMLIEDELAAAFISGNDNANLDNLPGQELDEVLPEEDQSSNDEWENTDEFPGQLAVDVYETADKLIIKARTAGISQSDLDVSISENILTISGVLSGGEDEQTTRWHLQECYWGEFSRTIALPVPTKQDENSVKAELRDGVLTISFEKEKPEEERRNIPIVKVK